MSSKVEPADAIAAELATLQVEEAPEGEETAPEAGEDASDPEASEGLEETEESEDEPSAVDAVDAETFKSELAELVDAGDLKAAAEKLGLDPSVFKLNNRQFKASRTAAREAKTLKIEAETKASQAVEAQTKAERLNARAEELYGPVVAGRHFYKGDPSKGVPPDPLKARAAIELLFEDSYENIFANLAKAARGMDPAQFEVLKLRQELAAEKARKEQETAAQSEAQASASELSGIAAKLKGTPLEALSDEAAADIQKVMRASYNKALGKYTKTLKEAYAEVKTGYAAKAAKLATLSGKTPAKAPSKDPRKPLDKTPLKVRAPVKKLTPEDEFAMELKAGKQETQAAERRERRRAK